MTLYENKVKYSGYENNLCFLMRKVNALEMAVPGSQDFSYLQDDVEDPGETEFEEGGDGGYWSGSAEIPAGTHLVATSGASAGALWKTGAVTVDTPFDTTFKIDQYGNLSSVQRHHSALSFVIQNDSQNPTLNVGADNGYGGGGVTKCIALEFDDTIDAAMHDPGNSHMTLMTNGDGIATADHDVAQIDTLNLGTAWNRIFPSGAPLGEFTCRIQYDGVDQWTINVSRIAQNPPDVTGPPMDTKHYSATYTLDIANTISLNSGKAYVGIMGAVSAGGSTSRWIAFHWSWASNAGLPQSEFFAYPTVDISDAISLGTPDGGIAIPDLDALAPAPDGNAALVCSKQITDIRDAIEALAANYTNVVTGNPFDWDDESTDNLYYVAMVGEGEYDWQRPTLTVGDPTYAEDIEELWYCIAKLDESEPI